MIVRKVLLVAGAAALMTTPAWALPSQAPSNHGTEHAPSTPAGPPATTPNNTDNPGSAHRSSHGGQGGGQSDPHANGNSGSNGPANTHRHKCAPHNVAYVVSGLLVSQTLSKDGTVTPTATTSNTSLHANADGTYSGDVTVDVKHTNHHAAGDKGKTVTYSVSHVRVTFALSDVNNDGSSGLDDLQAGDRVKLIGKITAIAKKCDHSSFTPRTTIRHIVFHNPPATPPS